MREMVDKVKRKEPLYGTSSLSPYMQGVASRNSRYSGVWLHVIPWFNFVNHEQVCAIIRLSYTMWENGSINLLQHGVDTAKYYRQAERELAAEQDSQSPVSQRLIQIIRHQGFLYCILDTLMATIHVKGRWFLFVITVFLAPSKAYILLPNQSTYHIFLLHSHRFTITNINNSFLKAYDSSKKNREF